MDVSSLLRRMFAASPVFCSSKKEEVGIDDPAFANMDPHLKIDESEDSMEDAEEGGPQQQQGGPRKVSHKPPPFHAI